MSPGKCEKWGVKTALSHLKGVCFAIIFRFNVSSSARFTDLNWKGNACNMLTMTIFCSLNFPMTMDVFRLVGPQS